MLGCCEMALSRARSDFAPGHVLRVQDASLRVAAFLAEVQFARAVWSRDFAFGEVHPQSINSTMRAGPSETIVRTTGSFAQPSARRQRVAHMQLERILFAGHRRDAALRVVCV